VIYAAPTTTAGGKNLLSLLPLALAAAIPLGLLALFFPVTTTIIGGRRKRQVMTTFVEGMSIYGGQEEKEVKPLGELGNHQMISSDLKRQ
jgi:hypothetical protein